MNKQLHILNLRKLLKYGIMSTGLRTAAKKLMIAIQKNDLKQIDKISYLHQYISGNMYAKNTL